MKKLWDLRIVLSFLELEGQGRDIIMEVTCSLLLTPNKSASSVPYVMNSKMKLPLTWAYLAIVYCQTSFQIITRLLDFLNWFILYSGTRIFQSSLLLHWIFAGYWYWLNNFNDGRMCYAALPGDVVRFRSFPCSDLLRVICQYGSDDTRPLLRQKQFLRGQTLTPPERPDPPKPKVKQKQSFGKSYPNKVFFPLTKPLTVKFVSTSTRKLGGVCPL